MLLQFSKVVKAFLDNKIFILIKEKNAKCLTVWISSVLNHPQVQNKNKYLKTCFSTYFVMSYTHQIEY